jgi:3-oxoacyl-[acyl-carrier-protein] synthase II
VPPTINLEDPDEAGEGLDLTPNVAARRDIRTAISNSFGFGGQNTALVFRRWDA